MTCPCNPDNSTDWCDEEGGPRATGGGSCSVAWCARHPPLFVHFGSFMFRPRLHEILQNSLWSCQGEGAARADAPGV
jgi:hypothetical protein